MLTIIKYQELEARKQCTSNKDEKAFMSELSKGGKIILPVLAQGTLD